MMQITQTPFACNNAAGTLIATTDICIAVKTLTSGTYYVTSTSVVQIRIYNLEVNGVPFNVGQHCQTSAPTTLVLRANSLTGQYSITNGGVLSGFVTLPTFTGCGVGENLDPLLNGSISGSGNFVKLTQGPTCVKFPEGPPNSNCKIGPGSPGYPYGLPAFYPKVKH
jgi:hypothetical protein